MDSALCEAAFRRPRISRFERGFVGEFNSNAMRLLLQPPVIPIGHQNPLPQIAIMSEDIVRSRPLFTTGVSIAAMRGDWNNRHQTRISQQPLTDHVPPMDEID